MTSGSARCALVTGAASGIGASAAVVLAEAGYSVALWDIAGLDEVTDDLLRPGRKWWP